ncbi:MAG: hypothetical protein LC791_11395 [Acidobacteria bacterium]|nr:hypothetical protein [Acidobacteriota bacterium]
MTRPGFTVFAVDQVGEQSPLAHFDGRAWRPPCSDDGRGSRARPDSFPSPAAPAPLPPSFTQITGLSGSAGAPLLRVRELTTDSTGWESAANAVEARAVAETDFAGPRSRAPRVYSADAAGSGVSYVEVVLRVPEPAFSGLVASAWVIEEADHPTTLVDFQVRTFASYDAYLALARAVPLGIVDKGDERVWVMAARAGPSEEVRLVRVSTRDASEQLRVAKDGC